MLIYTHAQLYTHTPLPPTCTKADLGFGSSSPVQPKVSTNVCDNSTLQAKAKAGCRGINIERSQAGKAGAGL